MFGNGVEEFFQAIGDGVTEYYTIYYPQLSKAKLSQVLCVCAHACVYLVIIVQSLQSILCMCLLTFVCACVSACIHTHMCS